MRTRIVIRLSGKERGRGAGRAPASPRQNVRSRRAGAPSERLRQRARRLVLGSLFAVGLWAALFGKGGLVDLQRARAEKARLNEQLAGQRERVEALEREVEWLQSDPAALERIAREQLGLARPGEVVFLLPKSND